MTIEEQAALQGYTVAVLVEAGVQDLEGFVRPGTDYDGEFRMVCASTGEHLTVNGTICLVHGAAAD